MLAELQIVLSLPHKMGLPIVFMFVKPRTCQIFIDITFLSYECYCMASLCSWTVWNWRKYLNNYDQMAIMVIKTMKATQKF